MPRLSTFTFLISSLISMASFATEPPDLISSNASSPEAMARMRNGEIVVENVNTSKSGGSVRVQALVNGDMQILWDFIASCDSAYDYVDGLLSCEVQSVISDSGVDTTMLGQSVKKSWIIPRLDYVIRVRRQPMTRVDFELVEGDLAAMQGGWRFWRLDNEDAYILTHEIRVEPSFPIPQWLVRRSMRKDLPDMLACVRGLADGSVQVSREQDLERCPKSAR